MKKLNWVLFAVLAILLTASCQKELSNESGPTIILAPSTLDSNYLDTVYEFETQVGVTDTIAFYTYKYDAQKRVVSINWQWGDFLLPYQDSGSIKYLYIGSDSLPYQSTLITTYDGMLVFDTINTFYTYDNAARLIKDSAVASDRGTANPYFRVRKYLNLYNYAAGKITRQSSDLPVIEPSPGAYPASFTLDTVIISNQNPISSVSYVSTINNTSFSKDYETVITYDNNPSPYYKLNISKSFSPIPVAEGADFIINFIGKNNSTNYNTNYPASGNNSNIIYTNIYLSNGYIKKKSYPSSFDPNFTDGYIYTYKAL
ncbi:hypothetical protein [Ferruginibacter sp.]